MSALADPCTAAALLSVISNTGHGAHNEDQLADNSTVGLSRFSQKRNADRVIIKDPGKLSNCAGLCVFTIGVKA